MTSLKNKSLRRSKMRHLLLFLSLLFFVAMHDYLVYKTLQRHAINNLNVCIANTVKRVMTENPNANREYLKNLEGAIVIDCHNETMFKYFYPPKAEVFFPYEGQ
jgi:hypothetical protein